MVWMALLIYASGGVLNDNGVYGERPVYSILIVHDGGAGITRKMGTGADITLMLLMC